MDRADRAVGGNIAALQSRPSHAFRLLLQEELVDAGDEQKTDAEGSDDDGPIMPSIEDDDQERASGEKPLC